jgi:DNA-binding GntR family transcriptional regulator
MNSLDQIRSTREQIGEALREDIFCGRLAPGEHISEAKLAERFGVSRGPIREALVELIHEGLLLSKPKCWVQVAPPAPDEFCDFLVPVRCAIETYALKQVFNDLNEEDFRVWDEILFRMERACRQKDLRTYVSLDMALHRYLLERAGPPDLLAIWRAILARVRFLFWRQVEKHCREFPDMIGLHGHHVALIAAFRSGDKDAAVKALESHIKR